MRRITCSFSADSPTFDERTGWNSAAYHVFARSVTSGSSCQTRRHDRVGKHFRYHVVRFREWAGNLQRVLRRAGANHQGPGWSSNGPDVRCSRNGRCGNVVWRPGFATSCDRLRSRNRRRAHLPDVPELPKRPKLLPHITTLAITYLAHIAVIQSLDGQSSEPSRAAQGITGAAPIGACGGARILTSEYAADFSYSSPSSP